MKILKALVSFEGDNGLFQSDAIERDGTYWLVPHWVGTQPGAKQTPVRLVGLVRCPFQLTPGSPFGDLVVEQPIPKAVYEGRAQPTAASGLVVIETPDL